MDLLSDVLRDLRLESAVLSVGELRAPWGLTKGSVGGAPFYMALEGHCVLEVDDGVPSEVSAGDLVVLPHGARHALLSSPDAPRTPFRQVLEANRVLGTWAPGMRVEETRRSAGSPC